MWGPPGIGKSEVVQEIADELKGLVIDLRMAQMEPTDIRGIPFYNKDTGKMDWAPPVEMPDEELASQYPLIVLFMDEMNSAPPAVSTQRTLAPRVNADGNELGGVPVVLHDAPLGTYLGWNITAAGFNQGKLCNYAGGVIPFARTKAEREANGDPRLSLEERYGNKSSYVRQVEAAVQRLRNDGFLLPEDAERLLKDARERDIGL